MPIPAGYTQLTTGFWRKDSDLSGPYAWTGAAFYLISTGVAGSGVPADYTQHPSGFWFKTADGSGPYSYDGTNFWLAGNGGPSGAITVATVNVSSAINMANGSTFNLYNTADQTTNYERLRADWSSSVARIYTTAGGTGTPRSLALGSISSAGNSPVNIVVVKRNATPFVQLTSDSTSLAGFLFQADGTFGANSVTQGSFAVAPTINQSGTAGYTAFEINPTETATGSGAKLLQRWAVGGTAVGYLTNSGSMAITSSFSASGFIGFASTLGGTLDVAMSRDAADTLALRRSTNAQAFRVYNTYTDGSNYERVTQRWSGSVFAILSEAAGTGTVRPFVLGTEGSAAITLRTGATDRWNFSSAGHFLANTDNIYDIGASGANRPRWIYTVGLSATYLRNVPTVVSSLVAPAAGNAGQRAYVTDSTVAMAGNFGTVVTGGGANSVPVISDGTNWRIG